MAVTHNTKEWAQITSHIVSDEYELTRNAPDLVHTISGSLAVNLNLSFGR